MIVLELLQLKYFCTVAELENMTAAAKRHLIPQSAMSVTVKRLEQELGVKLFDRIGNRIRLNEAGKNFYDRVKEGLTNIEKAVSGIGNPGEPNGEVRILVLEKRRTVAECIVSFRQKYPGVRFSVCHNLYEKTTSDFDICVSAGESGDDGFIAEKVRVERIGIAVPEGHRLWGRASVSVSELKSENIIMLPQENSVTRVAEKLCRRHGFEANTAIICDDPYCVRKYVSAGLGVAFTPLESWKGLYDGNVGIIELSDTDAIRTTAVSIKRTSALSGATVLFRNYLADWIRNN